VVRVELGEAAPIDEALEKVCKLMASGQIADKRLQPALQRLSELVYAPLARHLTNVEHLIVCPDGQLSRLPFEMLLHDGKYLVEQKTISYVGSGREVARLAQKASAAESRRLSAPLVMGDPDFDLDLEIATPAVTDVWSASLPSERSSRREEAQLETSGNRNQKSDIEQSLLTSAATAGFQTLSRSFTGRKFTRLPAAAEEARSVAKLLGDGVTLRLGAEAREAELKAVVSPRVLHLATHGFFLSDQEFKFTNALPELWASSQRRFRRPDFDWENPLIRCGIALAGANNSTNSALRTPHSALEEDGLLTGLEASLLNLQGTELVILSACESGTGEIKIGEGVMSLRRAFRIAGAETVLASHWPVSDKATGRLMTEFMRRWRAGEPRATAWREAQLALLRSPDFSSPCFWAAFTLTGQWR
jgi:CHAT domain-containing protein